MRPRRSDLKITIMYVLENWPVGEKNRIGHISSLVAYALGKEFRPTTRSHDASLSRSLRLLENEGYVALYRAGQTSRVTHVTRRRGGY